MIYFPVSLVYQSTAGSTDLTSLSICWSCVSLPCQFGMIQYLVGDMYSNKELNSNDTNNITNAESS